MKKNSIFLALSTILLSTGDLMGENLNQPHAEWVTIEDEVTGLRAAFPHAPLEMTFDHPFKNTPPEGQVHLYSVPIQKGLFVLSSFHSSQMTENQLRKENIYQFFQDILVPHFFFNPQVFEQDQSYEYLSAETERNTNPFPLFEFIFQDHGELKKLKGMALIKDQTLYIPFYLASEKDFDEKTFQYFLSSITY